MKNPYRVGNMGGLWKQGQNTPFCPRVKSARSGLGRTLWHADTLWHAKLKVSTVFFSWGTFIFACQSVSACQANNSRVAPALDGGKRWVAGGFGNKHGLWGSKGMPGISFFHTFIFWSLFSQTPHISHSIGVSWAGIERMKCCLGIFNVKIILYFYKLKH